MAAIDGIAEPKGGWQTGGWYSGRQYWGGTLSAPGQINSLSNQQGAGQQVSNEVIAQTNPNNVAYIQQEQAKAVAQTPQTKEQVAPYLENVQNNLFSASTSPEVKVPTMEELKSELAPTTAKPELLNRTEEFEKLRTQYGVAALEENLTTLKAQQDELYAELRQQKTSEEGKTVPMGVIGGRISEEERVYQERADYLGRQVSRATDELNTKYNVINAYMNFKGLDYQDAVSAYDKEFSQNLQIYDIIAGARKEARSAYEYDQDAAKANLQIYANAVMSGNVDYGSLSTDQKLMIQKLEVQSGLPVGFISSVRKDKDADIIFTTSNEGVTQVGFRNADGSVSVQSYGKRISSGSTSDAKAVRQQFTDSATMAAGNNFPDLVEKFANTMSLEEIYQAYANSEMGQKYGTPGESAQAIRLTWEVAKGIKTEDEARLELGY